MRLHGLNQRGRVLHARFDCRIVPIPPFVDLNMAGERCNPVADHLIGDAPHQGAGDDHAPDCNGSGHEDHERPAGGPPHVAPCKPEKPHDAPIACTGRRRRTLKTGITVVTMLIATTRPEPIARRKKRESRKHALGDAIEPGQLGRARNRDAM